MENMKYKIKVGRHYHNNWLMRIVNLFKTLTDPVSISWIVMLTESCYYPIDYVTYTGYNKLTGAGAINHHQRSARFVWNPDYDNKGNFVISSYVYESGEWKAMYLQTIKVGQQYKMSITITDNGYKFNINDSIWDVAHSNPTLRKPLDFYFGGSDFCYRDIVAYIK